MRLFSSNVFHKDNASKVHDGRTGQDLAWNMLNLISGVSKTVGGTTTQLASYNWYADGTKYSALRADGSGYVYKGGVIYEKTTGGTLSLDCVLTTGGRIVANKNSSGTITGYTVYHHITDHLGSVRAITNASTGNVVETSDFLPFGTRWSQTAGSSSSTLTDASNRWRYSGKEEQVIGGNDLGVLDFGARHYDPWLARWTTQDPMAGKYTSFTPYSYCAGNPVNMVDLDGQAITDYFDSSGKFLFTDGVDNGIIKITSSQTVEMAKELLSSDMINSYIDDNSVSFHYAFFSGIIDENSSLKIFNHYNRTGLSLDIDNKLSGYMEFNNKGENNSVRISVNINKSLNPNKQGFTLDNYHDISNAMNVHEGKGHYEKYKKLGPIKYSAIPSHLREISAIQLQMQDPSWKNTTELYKRGVEGYYQQQRKKTKQNDTSN